jgi:hypothetical protein
MRKQHEFQEAEATLQSNTEALGMIKEENLLLRVQYAEQQRNQVSCGTRRIPIHLDDLSKLEVNQLVTIIEHWVSNCSNSKNLFSLFR